MHVPRYRLRIQPGVVGGDGHDRHIVGAVSGHTTQQLAIRFNALTTCDRPPVPGKQ